MRMRPMCGLIPLFLLVASAQGALIPSTQSHSAASTTGAGNHDHWHRNRCHQLLVNRRSVDGSNLHSVDPGMHDPAAKAADRISLFAAGPRHADDPSNQTLIRLALILTLFIMQPVGQAIFKDAIQPMQENRIDATEALKRATPRCARLYVALRSRKGCGALRRASERAAS